jgi:hypothetical protein
MGAAGTAAVVAGAAALLMLIGRAGGRLQLAPGEQVLLSARPRKVVWRYAATLGLWEVARRATRFTVTDRRVVIEEGLLGRSSRSVPLSRIADVRTATGVWQGYVDLTGGGRGGTGRTQLGPLRNPVALAFATAVAHGVARAAAAGNHQPE